MKKITVILVALSLSLMCRAKLPSPPLNFFFKRDVVSNQKIELQKINICCNVLKIGTIWQYQSEFAFDSIVTQRKFGVVRHVFVKGNNRVIIEMDGYDMPRWAVFIEDHKITKMLGNKKTDRILYKRFIKHLAKPH